MSERRHSRGLNEKGKSVGKEEGKGEQDDSEKATMKDSSDDEVFEKKNGGTDEEGLKASSFSRSEEDDDHYKPHDGSPPLIPVLKKRSNVGSSSDKEHSELRSDQSVLPIKKRLSHRITLEDGDETCSTNVVPRTVSRDVTPSNEAIPEANPGKKTWPSLPPVPKFSSPNRSPIPPVPKFSSPNRPLIPPVPNFSSPNRSLIPPVPKFSSPSRPSLPAVPICSSRNRDKPHTSSSNTSKPVFKLAPLFLFEKTLISSDVLGRTSKLAIPSENAIHFPKPDIEGKTSKHVTIRIVDDQEETRKMKFTFHKNKGYRITRGWKAFVNEKQLQVGDVIRFYRSFGWKKHTTYSIKCGGAPKGDDSNDDPVQRSREPENDVVEVGRIAGGIYQQGRSWGSYGRRRQGKRVRVERKRKSSPIHGENVNLSEYLSDDSYESPDGDSDPIDSAYEYAGDEDAVDDNDDNNNGGGGGIGGED
ncbi:unnamed protein product [Ilex paraguariensis]|uniref:TF-B3 domain-containing protein n=1 Tax=Ilex paraguariensis TaxID=185542 RepID=A0ABC8R807_9AQUA